MRAQQVPRARHRSAAAYNTPAARSIRRGNSPGSVQCQVYLSSGGAPPRRYKKPRACHAGSLRTYARSPVTRIRLLRRLHKQPPRVNCRRSSAAWRLRASFGGRRQGPAAGGEADAQLPEFSVAREAYPSAALEIGGGVGFVPRARVYKVNG